LQNSVSFAEALAVFRPAGYKTAFFRGCSFKTEVLKEPPLRKPVYYNTIKTGNVKQKRAISSKDRQPRRKFTAA
jgi:hypothetical protein